MGRLTVQLLVIFTLLLPAPSLFAGGDDVKATTTTTKKKVKKAKGKAKAASSSSSASASAGLPYRKPIKKAGGSASTSAHIEPLAGGSAAEKEEVVVRSTEAVKVKLREQLKSEDHYLKPAATSSSVKKEEVKTLTARGLINVVLEAFKAVIDDDAWDERLAPQRARRDVGGSAVDASVEVSTGCCIPFFQNVFKRTSAAQDAVNKDGKIDTKQLALDIGKAIVIALKETLESEGAEGTVELIENFVQSIIDEVKSRLQNEQLLSAIELVEALSPFIIDQVKAEIAKWIENLDNSDDVDTLVDGDDDADDAAE